jgi:hypothetical protein
MLARFLTNTRGGVTPLMAVVAVPLMASVGIAVDYSRINAARTAFQVALDATALMMSKNAATGTDAQRQTEATNIFNAVQPARGHQHHRLANLHLSRRIEADPQRHRGRPHQFSRHNRRQPGRYQCFVGFDLGQYAPACGACARQHGLHGQRRQNGCSQDSVSQSADSAQDSVPAHIPAL